MNVNAKALLVNATDAAIGAIAQNPDIISLPLVNRDINTLLLLTPGAQAVTEARTFVDLREAPKVRNRLGHQTQVRDMNRRGPYTRMEPKTKSGLTVFYTDFAQHVSADIPIFG